MKYVWAGLAIVAAVAALFFRPPRSDLGLPSAGGVVGSVGGTLRGGGAVDERAASAGSSGLAGSESDRPARAPGRDASHSRVMGGSRSLAAQIVVYVAGEVNRPGVYTFGSGARAQEALIRAGGPKADADLVAVNLAARLDDGTEVAFPKIGSSEAPGRRTSGPHVRSSHAASDHRHGRRRRRSTTEGAPAHSVDLNAANASELEALPGIGPALAERIVDYRDTNGPFTSVDELADVSGITPHLQEEISDFVVIR